MFNPVAWISRCLLEFQDTLAQKDMERFQGFWQPWEIIRTQIGAIAELNPRHWEAKKQCWIERSLFYAWGLIDDDVISESNPWDFRLSMDNIKEMAEGSNNQEGTTIVESEPLFLHI